MTEIISIAFKNIYRKFSKMLLTIIGIAIGVASVVIISCISASGTIAVNNELNNLGLGGFIVSSNIKTGALINDKEINLIKNNSKIDSVTPIIVQTGIVENISATANESIIWGIDYNANKTIALNIKYGRFITKEDVVNKSKVCLVDVNFANKLYNRENITGKYISVKTENSYEKYLVIGVLETGGQLIQNAMGSVISNFIYTPYTSLQEQVGINGYQQVITKINSNFDNEIDNISKDIVNLLNRNSGLVEGYSAMNLAKQKDVLLNILELITLILTAVGGVSLIVASLSIMTVMLVSVTERTKEIGIKKSIGASKKYIILYAMGG